MYTESGRTFQSCTKRFTGRSLVYFDNAASSQKPRQVVDAITHLYYEDYSNIHRGVHTLSERSTRAYEEARRKVQEFIHAREDREIVFVRGTTEAINLVAHSFGQIAVGEGDEILITALEHHSNIVPGSCFVKERRPVCASHRLMMRGMFN